MLSEIQIINGLAKTTYHCYKGLITLRA